MQQWQSSPYGHRIMALQAFALDTANPGDVALAIQMIQVLQSPTHAYFLLCLLPSMLLGADMGQTDSMQHITALNAQGARR